MTRRPPTPFAAFISGTGRTLQNLVRNIESGALNARVCQVVASRECPGLEWAKAHGFPAVVRHGVIPRDELAQLMTQSGAEWGVLAGYTRLLDLPDLWQSRFTNIHPALLPSFGGPGWYADRVHRGVLEAGCRVSGCTVHLCDSTYDTGPILAQRCCPVMDDDTPQTLAQRVFEVECALYPEVLEQLFSGRVSIEAGRARIIPV